MPKINQDQTKRDEKTMGQVFTPDKVVELILNGVGYTVDNPAILNQKILEPSFGMGVFMYKIIDRLVKAGQIAGFTPQAIAKMIDRNVYGVELDQKIYTQALLRFQLHCKATYALNVKLPNLISGEALDYGHSGEFDFIVCNPPYVRVHNLSPATREKLKMLNSTTGNTDLYIAFFDLGLKWLNNDGKLGYITPNTWLRNGSQKKFRTDVVKNKNLTRVIDFGRKQLFEHTTTYSAITFMEHNSNQTGITFENRSTNKLSKATIPFIYLNKHLGEPFDFTSASDFNFLQDLAKKPNSINDKALVHNGLATLGDKYFILDRKSDKKAEPEFMRRAVKASTYRGEAIDTIILFPYKKEGNKTVGLTTSEFNATTGLKKLLTPFRKELSSRSLDKNTLWFHYGRSQAIQDISKRKLVISPIVAPNIDHITTYIVPAGTAVYSGLFITEKSGSGMKLDDIKAILDSPNFYKYIMAKGKDMSGGYKTLSAGLLKSYRF